jgi:uncharacterized protein YfaS (alpha-2-macroglobulin family)
MVTRAASVFAALFVAFCMWAAPAAAQMTRIETTPDHDYFGFDLRTERNVSQDQCANICVRDDGCRAFTYNPKAKWCFLKSDYSQLNAFPGAVAGRKVNVSGEPDMGAPAALTFLPTYVIDELTRYRTELLAGGKPDPTLGMGLLMASAESALSTNPRAAVESLRNALRISPDDRDLWSRLAVAVMLISTDSYSERGQLMAAATSATYQAYLLTRGRGERAASLAELARALDRRDLYRPAIESYRASLELVNSPEVQAAFEDLRARKGFRIVEHTVDSDTAEPRVCVQFSEPLLDSGTDYASFFTVDGRAPKAIDQTERQICVEGLEHGKHYDIVIRDGLPSRIGETLIAPVALNIYVRDRSPSIRFTGENFVLPSTARRGIPLVSVNTTEADISLHRIGDRALAQLLSGYQFLRQLDGYEAQSLDENLGQPIWEGKLDMSSELNKEVMTAFPLDEALRDRKPGVYVMVAIPKGDNSEYWYGKATQWFVVSDIGLQTYAGEDGLTVFTRSLATAKPSGGVEVTLLARNNEILGTATTDAEGKATLTAGLMRGTGSMAPAVLMAKTADDFVFLDMGRAGFDLSDRGVTGRPAPGALDVYSWTERGIYRTGETVHAAALARDDLAVAVENLPLTFIFTRPDGVEDRRFVENGAALGGYSVDLPLPATAMRGTWTMRVHADPQQPAISTLTFLVEDFVPDRIEFDLTSDADEVQVGEPANLTVDGRFLYGAPASGLSLEGEVSLSTLTEWDDFPGYKFGLADEQNDLSGNVTELTDLPLTDEDGKAEFPVSVDAIPATTRFVNAEVRVRMREGAGRAVERIIDIGIAPETEMIGIRPAFTGDEVPEGGNAEFSIIAISPEGERIDLPNLSWKLERIERRYQWYRSGNSWNYEPITTTTKVAAGTVDAKAGEAVTIGNSVTWGRYRLEVTSAASDGPASSVEFSAGWFVEASSTETPDGLEIALDKEKYADGEVARLNVSPRFAGELLIAVGTERLVQTINATVPAEGATIEIPVSDDWGAGAYVTATLFRPGDDQESRMPMRAIGLKWLAVDPGARKLDVSIETVEKTLPRQPLVIPVSIPAAANQTAYVTVAAVDVGILNLTSYKAPDPAGFYYGQRRLGIELRDIYGRLIDGSLGAMGRIRTGGDGGGMAVEGSPPTEKLVAFFEGPVQLDAQGRASVSFDIPQFNGTARVMVVAWTKDAVGSATKDVIIREPVVVLAGLPRFMAPGDTASMRLEIANTDGPAGEYRLTVESDGSVAADTPETTITLASGARQAVTVPLTAASTGAGSLLVRLTHADGTEVGHALSLPVRPGAMPVTNRRVVTLAANGGSVTIDGELLGDSLLDGASVSLGVTPLSAFDIPGLLVSLDRYPYGCAEQTTSRAMPLLYVADLAKQAGLEDDPSLQERLQGAIARVLSYQSNSGSFGLWGPGYGDLWLDAYVSDFLTRAKEQGFDVPAAGLRQALENLQNSLAYDVDVIERGPEIAYALYVLARNSRASAGDLRYYVDTKLDDFDTPLSRAQLGASLALYGDTLRAETAFRSALTLARGNADDYYRSDYGSMLRDGAAMLALAAESRPLPAMVPELISFAAEARSGKRWTSTQEEAWMLMAARALSAGSDAISIEVNGSAHQGGWSKRATGDEIAAEPVSIVNRGTTPVDAVVTTVAAPSQPLPAGGEGFTIERTYYTLDGETVNVQEVQQNERYVVVLQVTQENDWPSRTLVTDLLPAGFEIDNPGLVSSASLSNFDWLPQTEAAHLEFRDDRFVAAFDRDTVGEITLAYVVRAVTPGVFTHPAAQVEDMYRPEFNARTASGFMEVTAAQ